MVQRYLTTSRLSGYLGLRPHTIPRWSPQDKPPLVYINRVPHHTYDAINMWLAEPSRAYNFVSPPTIEQIIAGDMRFVLREVATEMLTEGVAPKDKDSYTWNRIKNGTLPSLELRPNTWVIEQGAVERFIAARGAVKRHLTFAQVDHAIAVSGGTLDRALGRGDLKTVSDPGHKRHKRVTQESLCALLSERLIPSHLRITAEEWLEDRALSSRPLMSVREVALYLGLIESDVRDLLVQGRLLYITAPAGIKFWVSPESAEAYRSRCSPLTHAEKMSIFGVSRVTLYKWYRRAAMVCPLHTHQDPRIMYRWCMVAYLQPLCGPGVDARRWIRNCLSGVRVWPSRYVETQNKLSHSRLKKMRECGELDYVMQPVRGYSYVAAQVERMERRG